MAIAVGDDPGALLLVAVRRNGELPLEFEKLRQAATDECVGTRPAPTASGTDDNPDDTPLYRTLAHIDRLAAKRYAGSFTGLSVEAVCDAAEDLPVGVGVVDPTAEPLIQDAFDAEHIKVVHVEQSHLDRSATPMGPSAGRPSSPWTCADTGS
ncbi:hypothetical protein ACWD1Z_04215 [Streptomyces sp. NPDC002784]